MRLLNRWLRRAGAVAAGAGLYATMIGDLEPWTVLQGAAVAAVALAVARPRALSRLPDVPPERSRRHLARLLARGVRDTLSGSWSVGLVAAGLRPVPRPGWLEVPVGSAPPIHPDVIALLETFTPGTLLVEHDEERGVMLFHLFDARETESVRRSLERSLGRRSAGERAGGGGER